MKGFIKMADEIKRIEKDILLKSLRTKEVPIKYITPNRDYSLLISETTFDKIVMRVLSSESIIKADELVVPVDFVGRKKMYCLFLLEGISYTFTATIIAIKGAFVTVESPPAIYKNLKRAFHRISPPSSISIAMRGAGLIYDLNYPSTALTSEETDKPYAYVDEHPDVVDIKTKAKTAVDKLNSLVTSYEIVLFKGNKPNTIEQKMISVTGKIILIKGGDEGGFVYPLKIDTHSFVTEKLFKQYLSATGNDEQFAVKTVKGYLNERQINHIAEDLFLPIMFHHYIIGCIHAYTQEGSGKSITCDTALSIYETGKLYALSLEMEGFFNEGKRSQKTFAPQLFDISASGFLVGVPRVHASAHHKPGDEFNILFYLPNLNMVGMARAKQKTSPRPPLLQARKIMGKAVIVRTTHDAINVFFGCKFTELEPEDMRFLFETIYGKEFTNPEDAENLQAVIPFITGPV
jgi:hypothetical protein